MYSTDIIDAWIPKTCTYEHNITIFVGSNRRVYFDAFSLCA